MKVFAEKFKDLINEYEREIVSVRDDSIKNCENIRRENKKIFRQLLIIKVTKGFWRSQPKINGKFFEDKIASSEWSVDYFQGGEGRTILKEALKEYYRDADKQYDKLNDFLFKKLENNNMKQWIEMALTDERVRKNVLGGYKSWNIFLRDAYNFKFIPIDIHEMRFQIRTGIFYYYLGENVHDPHVKEHYEYALRQFAKDFLSDVSISGYNLGENPGLVDKFIWLHCGDIKIENGKQVGGKGICAKKPDCDNCILKTACSLGKKKTII